LVERQLPKLNVAGSSPVARSTTPPPTLAPSLPRRRSPPGDRRSGAIPAGRYTQRIMYEGGGSLYFFPEEKVSDEQARRWLREGPPAKRLWVISHLLRFAQWNDIWSYVTRDEVRDVFAELELPPNLRAAWARMLKIETPVGQ
jgi:hypothetical protein